MVRARPAGNPLKQQPTRTGGPVARLPSDAAARLACHPEARAVWDRLAPSHRREHVEAILDAKRPETRVRRIDRMIEKLESPRPSLSNAASTRPMLAKLGIRSGQRILVLDADDAAMASWTPLPTDCTLYRRGGVSECDVVALYAETADQLGHRLPVAVRALAPEGVLWIAFPKQSSGRATTLTRDTGWESTKRSDITPLSLVSLDEVWSGEKFRHTPARLR